MIKKKGLARARNYKTNGKYTFLIIVGRYQHGQFSCSSLSVTGIPDDRSIGNNYDKQPVQVCKHLYRPKY